MALKLNTDAANEPISTSDAKTHLRVDGSSEDTYIDALVKSARRMSERFTGRALITQTWDLWLDEFPSISRLSNDDWWDGVKQGPITHVDDTRRFIEIPKPPLQSIVHLKTYDEDDNESTFASSKYFVDTISDPGRLALNEGEVWPTDLRPTNAINVQFTSGYGNSSSDVPQDIIQAIYLILSHFYENRGDVAAKMPASAIALLSPYKIMRL